MLGEHQSNRAWKCQLRPGPSLRPTRVFNWTTGDEWLSLTCYGHQSCYQAPTLTAPATIGSDGPAKRMMLLFREQRASLWSYQALRQREGRKEGGREEGKLPEDLMAPY